jgi:hypothetical protein
MDSCRKAGHGFVIRVSQNRILLNPADGKRLGLVARAWERVRVRVREDHPSIEG